MIRLGICVSFEHMAEAVRAGFEFAEVGLGGIAGMSDAEFEAAARLAADSGLPVRCCNGMLPGEIKVTGPDADEREQRDYLERAFSRARRLGVQTIVFGSGASRRVTEETTFHRAFHQIAEWLRLADEYAERYDLDIAIEPLRPKECNIINRVSEAVVLASLLDRPRVGVLADTFHMEQSGEALSALAQPGALLRHVHVSHSLGAAGRDFPYPGDDGDYVQLFSTLKDVGYEGGVSVEAGCKDFSQDAPRAFEALDKARSEAYRA